MLCPGLKEAHAIMYWTSCLQPLLEVGLSQLLGQHTA